MTAAGVMVQQPAVHGDLELLGEELPELRTGSQVLIVAKPSEKSAAAYASLRGVVKNKLGNTWMVQIVGKTGGVMHRSFAPEDLEVLS
jgi:hypothetical protein